MHAKLIYPWHFNDVGPLVELKCMWLYLRERLPLNKLICKPNATTFVIILPLLWSTISKFAFFIFVMLCHLSDNLPFMNLYFYTLSKNGHIDRRKHTTLNSILSVFNLGSKLLLKHCPLMYSYNHELCSCNSFWLRQFCTMRNWNMVWHVDPKRPSYCLWPQSSVNSNKLPFKLIYFSFQSWYDSNNIFRSISLKLV